MEFRSLLMRCEALVCLEQAIGLGTEGKNMPPNRNSIQAKPVKLHDNQGDHLIWIRHFSCSKGHIGCRAFKALAQTPIGRVFNQMIALEIMAQSYIFLFPDLLGVYVMGWQAFVLYRVIQTIQTYKSTPMSYKGYMRLPISDMSRMIQSTKQEVVISC